MNAMKKKNKKSKNYKLYSQITFLIILILYFGANGIKILSNSTTYNLAENRTAYKIELPSFDKIVNQTYQDELETAIGDQMLKYNYFKKAYSRFTGFVNLSTVFLFNMNESDKYLNLKSNNLFKNSLVYMYKNNDEFAATAKDDVIEINNILDNINSNVYLYFVKTDSNVNFETKEEMKPEDYLKEQLKLSDEKIKTFSFNNYDEYKKYFYLTDHHWNHKGSYKGYLEMADMMHLNNKLEIKEEVCFNNAKASGSKINNIGNYNFFKETFCKYEFDLPEFEIYVNNQPTIYGTPTEELKNSPSVSYASIYGFDDKEIIFINKNIDSNKKLLIFSNSFSNSVNKLLASHYKTTYVIDGRYYENLNLVDYIKENKIDDVLILGNNMLFGDSIEW